jgi:hypothetical protein
MSEKKPESFIIITTYDDKTFGIKNLRYEIRGDSFMAFAEVSGDEELTAQFLKEVTNVLKNHFETAYKKYGVIHPEK